MRKLALALCLVACGEAKSGPVASPQSVASADAGVESGDAPAPAPPDGEERHTLSPEAAAKRIATVKAIFEAQSAHDANRVASFYAKDAVITTPGVDDWEGRDMIRDEEARMFQDAPDAKFGLRRVLVKDDVAVVEWTSTGSAAPLPKRSARRFGANGVSIMHFAPDGLVKEEHDVLDASTVDAQLRADKRKTRETLMQPTGTADIRVARGTPEEDKNVEAADAIERTFESRDERAFAGALAEDVVWDDYTAPAPLRGRSDVVKMFQTLTTAFPDMKTTCESWGVEDFVAKQCVRSATHDGALVLASRKMPPTHAHVSIHFVEVLQLKRGVVAKCSHYADSEELSDALRANAPVFKKKKQ